MQLKILADENVDYQIIKNLRKNGFNVISILENYRGTPDKEILNLAMSKEALLLTEDKDFGEWIFAHKEKTIGIIYLRYSSDKVKNISNSLVNLLGKYENSLFNKFTVITVNKVRIRELP